MVEWFIIGGKREIGQRMRKQGGNSPLKPGCTITAGALRLAVIDGVSVTGAEVKLNGDEAGSVLTTVLEYPVLGEAIWE
jgi:hypothetical protein